MNTQTKKSFIIVGIGASAGGLEALQEFVKLLPKKSNCAFVLAQHLSPTYKSMMVDLLSRQTSKKIVEAQHGTIIRPEMLYITPPNHDITIQNGKLYLKPPLTQIGPKPSIDIFFESLANDQKNNAVAVILSGTGSDGSHGVRAIKAQGGITIAQEPESAKYDGMVISAINTGNIDFVLPIEHIVQEIHNITKYAQGEIKIDDKYEQKINRFDDIFHFLKEKKGIDFKDYKISTIRRRLARRMSALKIISISDYITYLKTNKSEANALYQDILIGVTYFFRDQEAFENLRLSVTSMLKHQKEKNSIRVWIPGCSTGEEAYTIGILLHQILGLKLIDYKIQIFATDIDDESLNVARKAKYPQACFQEIDDSILKKYFVRQGQYYHVIKTIRDMVIFSHHNINQDPPFLRLDMISCRNLLIYFNQKLQEKIFPVFHYALNTNGILFLGKSESVGKFSTLFEVIDKKDKIYKAQLTKTAPLSTYQYHPKQTTYDIPTAHHKDTQYTIQEATKDTITNLFLPNTVVINTNHDILYFQKELFPYLKISGGTASFNIFKMVNEQLNLELRSVLHTALKEKTSKKSRFIRFINEDDNILFIQIIVTPLLNITDKELYLVSFLEENEDEVRAMGAVMDDDTENFKTKELEFELKSTKEHLQTVIEELETSNEEMQSLNEELQSSNEELQSSNEELETSNEELQSSNEELQTAYSELDHINKEMRTKSIDLEKANTLLKKQKDKLLLTTKRFETAIEATNGGIFEYFIHNNKKGFLSTKFAKLLGFSKSELCKYEKNVQSFIESLVQKEQAEHYTTAYAKFIKEKNLFDMICKLKTKEQGYKHFHLSYKYVPIENETKIVGVIVDVDEKQNNMVELHVQKQKLNTIFDSVNNMILIKNGKELIEANGAFERYFGKTLQEFKRQHQCIGELFCEEKGDDSYLYVNNECTMKWVDTLAHSNKDYKVKIKIDNRFYHFKIVLKQIDLDDTHKEYLITLHDITTQVLYEEELLKNVQKQVEQLRQKDEMLLTQSKSAAMGEMISAIAHQWRQPLNTLSLYNLALESNENLTQEGIKEFREKSNQVILQMSQTIDDFRDFFKPNKSKEKFYIKTSIQKVLDLLEAQLTAHNIEVFNTIGSDICLINFKSEFEQVVINLINNAKDALLKHQSSTAKKSITIQSQQKKDTLIIEIIDNGGGIDKHIIHKIFQPYFTTKFESQGTGLGLYMSKMIVEKNMGGTIQAFNTKEGAKFQLMFKV